MSRRLPFVLISISLMAGALPLVFGGCGGPGTSTGNPLVDIKFGSYVTQNSFERFFFDPFFEQTAYASVTNLQLCFKRLRFKMSGESTSSNPSQDPNNQDFSIGQVSVLTTGTTLGSVQVRSGTFVRVEFDLDNSCPSGLSIQVTNANGSFSTNSGTTITFQGSFTALSGEKALSLGIQNIASQLNTVTNSSQVQSAAQAASGTF